jgi:hypothetical protein
MMNAKTFQPYIKTVEDVFEICYFLEAFRSSCFIWVCAVSINLL